MTLPELEELAERVTFRDWEPHFKFYGMDFLFWWTDGEFKTADRYVASCWTETSIVGAMRDAAYDGAKAQAERDFRVEPKGE